MADKPTYFAAPAKFRAWLEKHHATASELLVGFYKKGSGKPSITWPESVDQALCYGWIDGVRRGLDDERYTIRFTPRKPTSTWSAINVARVAELSKQGLMHPAGLAAFERRRAERTASYSYEQRDRAELDEAQRAAFRADARAWAWFQASPPGYRHMATYWVATAKKPETRQRRLATLIADSARGQKIGPLTRPDERPDGGPRAGSRGSAASATAADGPPRRGTGSSRAARTARAGAGSRRSRAGGRGRRR